MAKHVRHVTAPFTYHGTNTDRVLRVQRNLFLADRWDVIFAGCGVFVGTKRKAIEYADEDVSQHGGRVEIEKG